MNILDEIVEQKKSKSPNFQRASSPSRLMVKLVDGF
jgi:hypothetical protein